jgi:hypothetical protein
MDDIFIIVYSYRKVRMFVTFFPGNPADVQTVWLEQEDAIGRRERANVIKKFKTEMKRPVPIYRLITPAGTIGEGIGREKENVIGCQTAIVRELQRYLQ